MIPVSIGYDPTIPNPPNDPSQDVGTMQANALAISNAIARDHVPFGVTGTGLHNKSTYIAQSSDPAAINDSMVLFTKKVAYPTGTDTELFIRKAANDSNNPGSIIQLTDTEDGALAANPGYAWLPGGVLIQWGTVTVGIPPIVKTADIFFPVQFSADNKVFSIQVTLVAKPGTTNEVNYMSVLAGSVTKAKFAWNMATAPTNSYVNIGWVAIGA